MDLMNGTPFDPKKVIILQDPKSDKKNVYEFEYMKKPEMIQFGIFRRISLKKLNQRYKYKQSQKIQ